MAEDDLDGRTAKLAKFEASIGADLAELRSLNSSSGSQSEVALEMQAIEGERRSNDASRRENEQLLTLLKAAEHNPAQLIATPTTLLKSQPAISRLKDALIDAQVRTANLLGTFADEHPFVIAAREAESLIQKQLHDEVATAIKGIELDLSLNGERDAALNAKSVAGRERIARLAGARAEYANLVAAVDNYTKLVEAARKNLADARAKHASAHTASVIGRIDGVETGVRPVGPGRTTITAAGGVAGLILGLGVVFLFAGPVPVMMPESGRNSSGRATSTPTRTVRNVPRDHARRNDSAGRNAATAARRNEHSSERSSDLSLWWRPRGRHPSFRRGSVRMPLVALIILAAALVWGALYARRGSLALGAAVVVAIAYVLGYNFWHAHIGPLPLTLDRIVLVGLVAAFVAQWRWGRTRVEAALGQRLAAWRCCS